MKTTIYAAVIVLLAATMLTNCQTTNKKLEALKKVQETKDAEIKAIQASDLAIKDSIRSIKKNSEEMTNAYQKEIAGYQAKIWYDKQVNKILSEKKIEDLEQKNNAMIMRLSNFQDTAKGKDNLELFRYELGREMNELGKSLKAINS